MSRYTGPRLKKMRALGIDLPGLSRKSIERRPYPPGQHGPKARKKLTDYGKQLAEKQKLRLNYGLGERQIRRYMVEALRKYGLVRGLFKGAGRLLRCHPWNPGGLDPP